MLTWIILIAILLILAIIGTWAWSLLFGDFDGLGAVDKERNILQDNRQAVKAGAFEDLSFDLAARGYRQDQVDETIAALAARIEELEQATQNVAGQPGTEGSDTAAPV